MKPLWAALVLVACGEEAASSPNGPVSADSSSGALHAVVVTTPDPPQRGVNQAVVTLSGEGVHEGQAVKLTPWMPSHGHGTAVSPDVSALGAGQYQVTNLYLPMPGLWQLRIEAANDEVVPSIEVP
jgi:hypothetical protein